MIGKRPKMGENEPAMNLRFVTESNGLKEQCHISLFNCFEKEKCFPLYN